MSGRPKISAPVPLRDKLLASLASSSSGGTDIAGNNRLARSTSTTDLSQKKSYFGDLQSSRTPDPAGFRNFIKPVDQEKQLEDQRLKRYDLDYPQDYNDYLAQSLDKNSKWFSREKKRKLDLKKLLPYQAETHLDQAKYLSHILVHLYIAIKSMDLEGLVSISTKDLASIKNDIELTLDTDFFNADLSFDIEDDEEQGDDEEEDEDDDVRSSGVIGKVMPRSATVISVNHWTNELKTCLRMKFDLPLTLRASLAKVYYYLSLSTGQAIQTGLFIDLFVQLTDQYRKPLKEKKLLTLHHQDLLNYFEQFFSDPNPQFDVYNLQNHSDKDTYNLFLLLATNSNPFFQESSTREIYDWCLQRFSSVTANLSLTILSHTLPVFHTESFSVLEFIPSLFHLLTNNRNNKSCELQIIDLFGRISYTIYSLISEGKLDSESVFKDNGIFTTAQIDYVFNLLQDNLRIEHKVNSFNGIANILVYSLFPSSSSHAIERLEILLSSLQTFVHPSNSGRWTVLIARFTHRFFMKVHKRYLAEKDLESLLPENLRLTNQTFTQVIYPFKDLILVGTQSKKENAANYYVASLSYSCDLPSDYKHYLINKVLLDLYDALTDQFVNSNHRIIVSLKQLTDIARFIIDDRVYRVHITNILILLISKIGTNDLELTNMAINAILTIFSLVQVKDLSKEEDYVSFESTTANFIQEHLYFIKQYPDQAFEADPSAVNSAFVASTQAFKLIVKNFVDSYFTLLTADLTEKLNFKLSQTVLILTQSLSDDLFSFFARIVEEKLFDGELTNDGENEAILANLVGSIIKRDSSRANRFFDRLSGLVRQEVHQGAGKTRNNTSKLLGQDKMLILYLTVLGEVLASFLSEILDFKKEYLDLIKFLYENVSNPSIQGSITYLVHKTLKNLTNIKLKENFVFQNEPLEDDFDSRWGLNYLEESRFDEDNLKFDWYIPSSAEVGFAIEIFEVVVVEALSKIDNISAGVQGSDISKNDEIIKNLIYLSSAVSGLSILFDPDFIHDDENPTLHKSSLEKKLLILKSLKASQGEGNELNIDIEEINKKDEHLVSETPSSENGLDSGAVKLNSENNISDFLNNDGTTSPAASESHANTRAATPSVPHEGDMMSVMNPKLALRESKIYNCLYFFGRDAATKRSSVDYSHVHSLRSLIGQSLHTLAIQLLDKEETSIKLIQTLLLTIRTYFCDVGKQSTFDFDDQLFIDYGFIKKVQSLGNYKKPFTRAGIGARIEKYHRQRIVLHSTNRFQTKLDKALLKDVVKFSASAYSPVYQPAHAVLVQAIKKLIGSYSQSISNILDLLEENIEKKDFKSIEAGLRTLRLKKISQKLIHDYRNLKRVISILCQCLKLNNVETNELAQKCFTDIGYSIQVPSPVALFRIDEIDSAIRPPRKNIDLEISTVKAAKDLKRESYYLTLNDLQNYLIEQEQANDHWSISLHHLKVLLYLQGFYELKTDARVLELIVLRSRSNHPALVRLCVSAVTKLTQKVISFASYDHDIQNTFDISYIREGVFTVDTSDNFSEKFAQELKNFQDPNYFIDSKIYKGSLFWGKDLKVLKSGPDSVTLSNEDETILASAGKIITVEWLDFILKILTQENEDKGVFQSGDVLLIKNIVQLIYYNASQADYKDLLQLIVEHYDKSQKESVIISCEIVCGLLGASAYTSEENIVIRDQFLTEFFDAVLSSDLTPDTSIVWNIMFWLVPAKNDIRRIPILLNTANSLLSSLDVDSDLAFLQSARISFVCSIITSLGTRFSDQEAVFREMIFAHPYTQVRSTMAGLLAVLHQNIHFEHYDTSDSFLLAQSNTSFGTAAFQLPDEFKKLLIKLFEEAESLRIKVQLLSPQEQMKSDYYYLSFTLLRWLEITLNNNVAISIIPLLSDHVAPFLMNLLNNKELCKLGSLYPDYSFKRLGDIYCRPEHISQLLSICLIEYSSIHQIQLQLEFIQNFYSRTFLFLTDSQKDQIIQKIDGLIFNDSIEVRTSTSKVLSGIIHNSQDLTKIDTIISNYNDILSKLKGKKALNPKQIAKLHGSTVGLGALISAFPYTSPPPKWIPYEISILSKATSIPGQVGKAAKDILSSFKKLRADTWHIDKESFSEDQLEDLEGVLWRSYFA